MKFDVKALADGVIATVKQYVQDAVTRMEGRIEALNDQIQAIPAGAAGSDGRDGANGKDGRDGADGKDGMSGEKGVDGAQGPRGEKGDPGPRGEKGDPGPRGEKGDPGSTGATGEAGQQGERGEKGEPGQPGQDGKDGRDGIDGKDGMPGENGVNGTNGRDGVDGKDGQSFTIEQADSLLAEKMARWELDFERRATAVLEKAIDRMPIPKDGKDGKDGTNGNDGRDGVGFDDLTVEYDGAKTVTFQLKRGDVCKEFSLELPIIMDRGVYKDGEAYLPGDGVTWAGSYWIAKEATNAKPDAENSGFRLAVKKGRDGRDGRNGIDKTAPVNLEK